MAIFDARRPHPYCVIPGDEWDENGPMDEWRYDGGLGLARTPAGAKPLSRSDALGLLASVTHGRVVFTKNALPAIRTLNHIIDDGKIIVRTRLESAISTALRGNHDLIVAYQADHLDTVRRTAWSVVATGRVHTVIDPDQITRYESLVKPWVNHADTVLAIEPDLVSGFRITPP